MSPSATSALLKKGPTPTRQWLQVLRRYLAGLISSAAGHLSLPSSKTAGRQAATQPQRAGHCNPAANHTQLAGRASDAARQEAGRCTPQLHTRHAPTSTLLGLPCSGQGSASALHTNSSPSSTRDMSAALGERGWVSSLGSGIGSGMCVGTSAADPAVSQAKSANKRVRSMAAGMGPQDGRHVPTQCHLQRARVQKVC